MADFSIQYAQGTVSGQSGAAPITADVGAPYRAIADLGAGIYNLGADAQYRNQKRREEEYKLQVTAETENGKIAIDEFDRDTKLKLQGVTDPEQIEKIANERLQQRFQVSQSFAKLPESKSNLDLYSRNKAVNHIEELENIRYKQVQSNAYVAFDTKYNSLLQEGKFQEAGIYATANFKSGVITDKDLAGRLESIPVQKKAWDKSVSEEVVSKLVQSGVNTKTVNQTIETMTDDATERTELMRFATTERNTIEAQMISNDKAAIEAELKYIDDKFILPQDEFLASVPDMLKRINESEILPVKGENGAGKEGQRKKIEDRIAAISEGKTDPVYEFDAEYFNQLSQRISNNPHGVSEAEINNAAGRGKNRGITAGENGQQGQLIKTKRFLQNDIANARLFSLYSDNINSLKQAKAFHQTKKKNDALAAEARTLLNAWATSESRTENDYRMFYDGLIDTIEMDGLSKGWFWTHKNTEQKIQSERMESYVRSLGVGLGDEPTGNTYKKGDTKIINGTTWTFNGKEWNS